MTTVPAGWEVTARRGWAGWGLLVVLLLVGIGAVYGGIGLVADGMGMPTAWLVHLPVHTWTLPGIALLVTVALPQLVAAWFVWRRDHRAGVVGVAAGAALVLWIAVQLLLLQRYYFLQPVVAVLGVVEVLLALWWVRASRSSTTHRPSVARGAPTG